MLCDIDVLINLQCFFYSIFYFLFETLWPGDEKTYNAGFGNKQGFKHARVMNFSNS